MLRQKMTRDITTIDLPSSSHLWRTVTFINSTSRQTRIVSLHRKIERNHLCRTSGIVEYCLFCSISVRPLHRKTRQLELKSLISCPHSSRLSSHRFISPIQLRRRKATIYIVGHSRTLALSSMLFGRVLIDREREKENGWLAKEQALPVEKRQAEEGRQNEWTGHTDRSSTPPNFHSFSHPNSPPLLAYPSRLYSKPLTIPAKFRLTTDQTQGAGETPGGRENYARLTINAVVVIP